MQHDTDIPARRKLTRGEAIAAKCKDCIYDRAAPGAWTAQVAQCSATDCALWPLRPAPRSGPFANPPRDPDNVPETWRLAPIGAAYSVPGETYRTGPLPTPGVAP